MMWNKSKIPHGTLVRDETDLWIRCDCKYDGNLYLSTDLYEKLEQKIKCKGCGREFVVKLTIETVEPVE